MAPRRAHPVAHSVAGLVAGSASTTLLYPLDLVKVRFQVEQSTTLPAVWVKMRTIMREEGWRALFAGLTPGLVASGVSWGGFFFFYERAKARWRADSNVVLRDAAASIEAGSIMVLVTNPVWLIKTRLQLQRGGTGGTEATLGVVPYRGMLDAFARIVREEGVRALYRGVLPSLFLTSHGAIQLVVYEKLKRLRQPDGPSASLALAYGSIAKLAASVATYPYQVVKTRLQRRYPSATTKYASNLVGGEVARTWRCIEDAWRLEGPRGFFKGVWPNSLRVIPNAAITFWVYELVLRSLATIPPSA